jgi:hypothetical protein
MSKGVKEFKDGRMEIPKSVQNANLKNQNCGIRRRRMTSLILHFAFLFLIYHYSRNVKAALAKKKILRRDNRIIL